MWWVFGGLMASLLTIGILLMRRRAAAREDELVSIVLLRGAPRVLSESDVRGMLRRAGAPACELMPLPPIAPELSGYAVLHDKAALFYFMCAARPYCDDPQTESLKFEDPRGRAAYAAHKAWVSIDAVGGMPPKDVRDKVLALMARITAELMDHESTLIYATWLDRVALPSAQAESTLRGENPLSLFHADDELNAPIMQTKAGDASIKRATAEAQRNYPTLLAAWERAGKESNAMVKGRFECDGRVEFMWIAVESVSDGSISGELGNEPAHMPDMKKGQRVTVRHEDVVDWACTIDGKPQGMYVEKILRKQGAQ
jgi:uncharacterized protein YegJ (DUF2314 family)